MTSASGRHVRLGTVSTNNQAIKLRVSLLDEMMYEMKHDVSLFLYHAMIKPLFILLFLSLILLN